MSLPEVTGRGGTSPFDAIRQTRPDGTERLDLVPISDLLSEMSPEHRRETADKFYERVAAPNERGCSEWQGPRNRTGYGAVSVRSRSVLAHRMAWVLAYGVDVPAHLVLDHTCRNRSCVSLEHLRAVTQRENVLCGAGLAADQAKQTHCRKAGHPLSGSNLIHSKRGRRVCRECNRIRRQEQRAALKAVQQ